MSSFVFYKFKSQKEPSRISFDGTGISVWQLKHEIILENKMGKGQDFDFAIYNADTEEEYSDDRTVVPRSTSILARRLPPAKAGRGNAQFYMAQAGGGAGAAPGANGATQGGGAGQWKPGAMSKRFDGKDEVRASSSQEPIQVMLPAAAPAEEANALAAMFAQTTQQWQETQEQMANATHIPFNRSGPARPRPPPTHHHSLTLNSGSSTPNANPSSSSTAPSTSTSVISSVAASHGHGNAATAAANGGRLPFQYRDRDGNASHKPPPSGYICYRCGQKGHWIQECPTNDDRAYDDRPRIKRTTGIPKSFLTTVEGPGEAGSAGVMVTAEGGFVVARPDNASWLAHRRITKNLSATDVQNLAPTDPDLTCPICSKLLRDATLTPCCSTSFCEDCVTNALADNDMLCPDCETRVKNMGKLIEDKVRREKVAKYIEEVVEASKEVIEEEEGEEGETEEVDAEEIKAESPEVQPAAAPVTTATSNGGNTPMERTPSSSTPQPPASTSPPPTSQPLSQPSMSNPPPPFQMPQGLNAQQQQQLLRQQQLRAMAMSNPNPMGMGMMGVPSAPMLQQQIYSLQLSLQNPTLHPQMRMNMLAQLQQYQMMAVQMGLVPGPGGGVGVGRGMNGAVAAAYGGNFANQRPQGNGNGSGMATPMAMANGNNNGGRQIPTGPRIPEGQVEGLQQQQQQESRKQMLKRQRPADFVEVGPARKKDESTGEVAATV